MKCKLSTINGWCGIFNKSCKECISPKCEFIKKAYRQGRVEAEYFGYHKREWIPVSERLPEVATSHNTRWGKSTDSIRVLCACVQADGKKMVKEGYCKVHSDGVVCWKIPGTIHSVTHWMPLPLPPKEGE